MLDESTWRVIRVRTGREDAVQRLLRPAIPAYSPHEVVRRIRHRRHGEDYPVDLWLALLPGYAFVSCSIDQLATVRSTDDVLPRFAPGHGVARDLRPKETMIVMQLRDAEMAGLLDRRPKRYELTVGSLVAVTIIDQAAPVIGRVVRAKTYAKRVRILTQMFGVSREVEVAVDKITALCNNP